MTAITQTSKAIIEFSITWHDHGVAHLDRVWANPVNFWRDLLPAPLAGALLGQGAAGKAVARLPATAFFAPYAAAKRVVLRPEQWLGQDRFGNDIKLSPGRFYPQGLLQGVPGVFRVSTAPCRFVGNDGERLIFDLNHPLAGYDLDLAADIQEILPPGKEKGGRCEDWLERISADGPGIQADGVSLAHLLRDPANFRRINEEPDGDFYRQARLVHHLDSSARAELARQYGRLIPAGARVLDLMASWSSHLPTEPAIASLTLVGMNNEELAANPAAGERCQQDLNLCPTLPWPDHCFDAVICTASIEYLQQPLAVLAEAGRVLRPGGLLIIAFSNRWFPTKAIRIWTELHDFERLGLVSAMVGATGGFRRITTLSRRGLPRPIDDPHQELANSDPLYMVWGEKE